MGRVQSGRVSSYVHLLRPGVEALRSIAVSLAWPRRESKRKMKRKEGSHHREILSENEPGKTEKGEFQADKEVVDASKTTGAAIQPEHETGAVPLTHSSHSL